jgi:hypothetical protein
MDLSDADLERIPEADRREVNPSVPVDAATWSRAGQLDWWVKERREWLGRMRGVDGRQRWIRLLICVLRVARVRDLIDCRT